MQAGRADIDRAVGELAARLPGALAPLAELAYNYRWAWLPGASEVFADLEPERWEACGNNPVRLLQEARWSRIARAAEDDGYVSRVGTLADALRAERDAPAAPGPVGPERPVAFLCAEYAIHPSLPIYSGGLGVLAGDIVKEASDRRLPLVGVGLMYARGYFRQRIDASGWQQEHWQPTDPERTAATLVTGEDGTLVTVSVCVRDEEIKARVWRVDVGRVPLFLLDTDIPDNQPLTRAIGARLYDGDPDVRLAQYLLLGVGGLAALNALGIDPAVVHLNEGHAAFASLALARRAAGNGTTFEQALEDSRRRIVFTTHTPVPAGNDTYPAEAITDSLRSLAAELSVDPETIIRLGRTNPDDGHEPFGVTQFALRTSRKANAVSRRHGEVARRMWHGLWPDRPVEDVPITHVTNGVHAPTWIGPAMRTLLGRYVGTDWAERCAEPEAWHAIDAIPDAELWAVREEQRIRLVDYVRRRSVDDRLQRGEPRTYVEGAATAFDPDKLTIGFARRLATYKRLNLLLLDFERALRLLEGERPIQLLIAGKAHPRDEDGKRLVQELFQARSAPHAAERVVFLEDYDLSVGARLVQGCDVWVNVPRPPLEASGTSGMKSVLNGGLQLSVLDGWWAEAYDGSNGWAISGEEDFDHGAQDHRDASELYRLLEEEVVPSFHDRDGDGVPAAWVARVKSSLRTLAPQFCAGRMVRDYEERIYAG